MQVETKISAIFGVCVSLLLGISILFLHYWHFESTIISLGTFSYWYYRAYHLSIFTCLQNVTSNRSYPGRAIHIQSSFGIFSQVTLFYKANTYSAHMASMIEVLWLLGFLLYHIFLYSVMCFTRFLLNEVISSEPYLEDARNVEEHGRKENE